MGIKFTNREYLDLKKIYYKLVYNQLKFEAGIATLLDTDIYTY